MKKLRYFKRLIFEDILWMDTLSNLVLALLVRLPIIAIIVGYIVISIALNK